MTGYVLVRTDGKFVAPPGQEKSYVSSLQDALVFRTREEADKNRCVENESVRALADMLNVAR
jgi:hypothetical protein